MSTKAPKVEKLVMDEGSLIGSQAPVVQAHPPADNHDCHCGQLIQVAEVIKIELVGDMKAACKYIHVPCAHGTHPE